MTIVFHGQVTELARYIRNGTFFANVAIARLERRRALTPLRHAQIYPQIVWIKPNPVVSHSLT